MSEHICTRENPMPISIADKVEELGQHWTHMDVEELNDYDNVVEYGCNNCGHKFMVRF